MADILYYIKLKQTFCASSCLSKLTKPNPLDLPLSSVITLTLSAGPVYKKTTKRHRISHISLVTWQLVKFMPLKLWHLTIFAKQFFQLLVVHVLAKVLNVNVGKLSGTCAQLSLPLFAGFKTSDKPVMKLKNFRNNIFRLWYFLKFSKKPKTLDKIFKVELSVLLTFTFHMTTYNAVLKPWTFPLQEF